MPTSPSFDPFAEDEGPTANPFEASPDSSPANPFEEPNPSAPGFDPFSDGAQSESIQDGENEEAEVPLGDVFGDPPPSNDNESFRIFRKHPLRLPLLILSKTKTASTSRYGNGSPVGIRTPTKGTKNLCATITPPG